MQTQIFLCNVDYCDFVVCTFPEVQSEPTIHIERIYPDDKLWSDCVVKSLDFFKTCVLPEIMGKWYTKSRGSNSASSELTSSNLPDSNLSFDGNVPSSSTNSNTPPSTSGVSATSIASATTMKTYCYCNEPEDESRDMICRL